MALGLGSLRGGGRDGAVVALRADTGQFNRDITAAEAKWRDSVGSMSREAIRLDLAQDRLKRSLAQYGAESSQAKRATIALKDAEELATRSARNLDRAHRTAGRGFGGLSLSATALVGGLIGGGSVVYALRSVADAAKESELVLGQTRLSVQAAGLSWDTYANRIEQVIKTQSRLGFDDEALLKTFSTFVTRTHDVNEALRLNALAADVARGRYIDLEAASKIVLKASLGQSGQLRRLGIDVSKTATAYELLTKLTEAYGGRAAGATGTAVAASDRLTVSSENLREAIGRGLTPTIAGLSDRLAAYLDAAGRQEEIQRKVTSAVTDGTKVVHGLASGLEDLRAATAPVVDAMGGLDHAVETLVVAGVLRRIGLLRLGIAGVGRAAVVSTGQIAAMGAAANTSAGSVGRLGTIARGLNAVSVAGFVAALGAQALHAQFDEPNTITPAMLKDPATRKRIEKAIGRDGLAKLDQALTVAEGIGARPDEGTRGGRTSDRRAANPSRNRASGDGLTRFQRLSNAVLEADLTKGLADDLVAARNLEAYYAKIAANKKLHGDKLFEARQNLLNAQQRVQSIEDQIAADRADAAEKAAAKRKAANERQRKLLDQLDREGRTAANQLYSSPQALANARRHQVEDIRAKSGNKALTAAEVQAMIGRQQHDFLVAFEQLRRLGSNIQRTDGGSGPPITVNLHSSSPVTDPAELSRGIRYAAFHLRSAV